MDFTRFTKESVTSHVLLTNSKMLYSLFDNEHVQKVDMMKCVGYLTKNIHPPLYIPLFCFPVYPLKIERACIILYKETFIVALYEFPTFIAVTHNKLNPVFTSQVLIYQSLLLVRFPSRSLLSLPSLSLLPITSISFSKLPAMSFYSS